MMNEDWRYTPERLALREQVLGILLKKYGGLLNDDGTPVNENQPFMNVLMIGYHKVMPVPMVLSSIMRHITNEVCYQSQ